MNDLKLPKLPKTPKNYRWRITKGNASKGYDAVYLKLEWLYKKSWLLGDYWTVQRREYICVTLDESLIDAVEAEADRIWAEEFVEKESRKIVGTYYGGNA